MKSVSQYIYCLTSLAILCVLPACNNAPLITVNTDYDHAATFGKYHSYGLDTPSIGLTPTRSTALQSSLRSSLAGRGLKESASNYNLYIVPSVFTQAKLNVMPRGGYTYYPSAYGGYRMGTRTMNAEVQQYTDSTLVIAFVDRKTHKVVYRGLAQAAVGSTERN